MSDYNPNDGNTRPSFTDLAEIKPENGLEAAELYTDMGLRVVPCQGKKPLQKDWTKLRLDPEDLPRYFDDGQNVGLLMGEPSGWLVNADLDVEEARKTADRFLEDTLTGGRRSTPGAHRWYSSPGAKNKKWLDTDGVVLLETRSTGSLTLVEPSAHPSGESYAWGRDGLLEAVKIASEDLEKRCTELATATVVSRHLPPIGGRHEYAKALIGFLLRRLDEETVRKIVLAAWHAGDGDGEEAVRDLEGIVRDTGRRLAEGENAFGGPTLEEMVPGLPKLLNGWWGWENGERKNDGAAGGAKKAPTHDELRDRWLGKQSSPIAYGQSEWRRYGAGFWAPVHDQFVYGEIDEVLTEAKPEGIKPTAGTRGSVEKLAQAKAFVPDEAWDANEDILVCKNGTLEISRRDLREHRPEDYALGAVPYEFDSAAYAPAWYAFLASIVPKAASFLQEYSGYSLTVDTSLEKAVWLYGPPGSGKSTYIEGQKAMLGNRAGLLGLADIQRNRFALSNLPGKTLVVATEQPSDFIQSTHVLNAIISGEEVPVEKKFKDAYTIAPRAKILWAMNDTPRVKDANDGLFRRVEVVPFPKLRVEPDPGLKERIKEEGAGILVWALEGLKRLRERGYFEIPEVVREATDEFRRTSDVPEIFANDACITSDAENCEEQADPLYKAYRHYCLEHGYQPKSAKIVAKDWIRLGFQKKHRQGRVYYTGIKVNPGWISKQDDYPRSR